MENARELKYEGLELFGQTVMFTCLRIDRSTVPEGLFAYDLRHDDNCDGKICEAAPYIMVNHWGTILCREPIAMPDSKYRAVTEDDYSYTGEEIALDDYLAGQTEAEGMAMTQ